MESVAVDGGVKNELDAEREACFAEPRKKLSQPRARGEQAAWDELWEQVEQHRLKVRPDSGVVQIVRGMRGGWDD